MQLEDYFDFLGTDDIRLKGTRVGIETVLYDYIHRSHAPEQIAASYVSITLEQVYATILYYLHNREAVTAYLADWLEYGQRMRAAQAQDPAFLDFTARLRQMQQGTPRQPLSATAGNQP